ncbi:MAG: hypothetical protein AAGF73_10200 [Actinomycetota bacterium]
MRLLADVEVTAVSTLDVDVAPPLELVDTIRLDQVNPEGVSSTSVGVTTAAGADVPIETFESPSALLPLVPSDRLDPIDVHGTSAWAITSSP